jgi:aspartate aminotransferase-like enzyme
MIFHKKNYLLTPGPTQIPPEVIESQVKPIIHHRTQRFREIFKKVSDDLKYVFQTRQPVITFTSSGTGAMESAVSNLLNDKIKALCIVGGKFGERWKEICESYKVKIEILEIGWGEAPNLEKIDEILKKDSEIKVVFSTLCETSTGVLTDVKKLAEICNNKNVILVVDAISGLGADELKMDDWGVDVVVAGSQKGLMLPPGLSFISLSEKAWNYVKESNLPKYYFDLKKARKSLEKDDSPFTPAITLIIGLEKSLELIREEGIENIWKRHALLAESTRVTMKEMGLKLFAKSPANAVTSVISPEGIDSSQLIKFIRKEYGVSIAGGQAKLKGKIFRIAHLGYVNFLDIIVGISALEIGLEHFGYKTKQNNAVEIFKNRYFGQI